MLRERLFKASEGDISCIPNLVCSNHRFGVRRPLGSHPKCFPFDLAHHISPLPASCCQLGKMEALHQMEQGNSVPLTELAFLLPEAGNNFTITSRPVSPINTVSVFRRFQQVPKLVGQERAVAVVGQARIQNLLLVSPTLTVQDRQVPILPVQPAKPLLHLPSVFSPADRMQMPRYGFFVRPPSTGTNVDVKTRFDHPNIVQTLNPA
jgi:hypothetical protein